LYFVGAEFSNCLTGPWQEVVGGVLCVFCIAPLSRIDTTDAGREQVNAGQQVSPEYILRSDITAWDVTEV
jgi:hypothetical protein